MFDYLKSHPSLAVALLVMALFIYGLYNGTGEQPPRYSPEAVEEVRTMFLDFQFPAQYPNRRAFSDAAFKFRQRGYGIGLDGSCTDANGNRYQIAVIELPSGSEELIIVYRFSKTLEDPLDYVSHFVIEHKAEDEHVRPRRTIEIDESSIRFLSNGQGYKSHRFKTNETDKRSDSHPVNPSEGSAAL